MKVTLLIVIMTLLVILIACQQTTTPSASEPQKMLIQCSNGQVVNDVSQCPQQASASESTVPEQQEVQSKPEIESTVKQMDTTTIPATKTQLQELLEKAPTAYTFDIKESKFVVLGNKRRMLYTTPGSDHKKASVYDDSEKMLYVYYGEILAKWWVDHKHLPALTGMDASTKKYPAYLKIQITGNRETDEANLPKDDYNRQLIVSKGVLNIAYEKGPIDFLKIYQSEPVLKTDTVPKQITTMNGQSNIAFHFNSKESPGEVIILRIHEGTQLPLLIEEINQQGIVTKSYEYKFDTRLVDKPITEDDLALAKEAIIVTPYDDIRAYKKYLDEKDKSSGGDTYNVDIYII